MKRDVIVFSLLASVLWYWILLSIVAVFAPGIIYPTMYFSGMPLLRAFVSGTVLACLAGICSAVAAGALIEAWTRNAGRFAFLKVLVVAFGVAIASALIAFLPVSSDPDKKILLLLGFIFLCVFVSITMSWLIIQCIKRVIAFASRSAS